MTRPLRRSRPLAVAAAVVLTIAASVALAAPAHADTRPAQPSTPATVSTDSLPTAQLADGVAWAQVVIGDTVYVGGSFRGARAAGATTGSSARSNLMAYDLKTGALKSFAPNLNGEVRALAASPDGTTLYVGGAFTTVNGTSRSRLAALDPTTGAAKAWNPAPNYTVKAIAATSSTVFFGGGFTAVAGTTRSRVAAASASTGVLTAWVPQVADNSVTNLVLNPGATKIAISGFFSKINGAAGAGFAIVDTTTGTVNANTPIRSTITDGSPSSVIDGLSSDGTNVYGSGYYAQNDPSRTGNLEGSFAVNWATGATVWVEDCHGDEYSNAVLNGVLYVVGHPHYCADVPGGFPQTPSTSGPAAPTYQRSIAFTTAGSGQNLKAPSILQPRYFDFSSFQSPSLLDWFPTLAPGTFTGLQQSAYSIVASGSYLLLAGEFPSVNGTTQYGTARFGLSSVAPDTDGPQLAGGAFPVNPQSLTSGTVRVAWRANYDRDNENLTYTLFRGTTAIYTTSAASRIWYDRPQLAYTDSGLTPGSSQAYHVVAKDPFGNTATGASATVTVAGAPVGAYRRQVIADGATSYWRLGGSGPAVADSSGTVPATATSGVTFGVPGAIAGDSDTAAAFDGDATRGTTISSTTWQNATQTFSVGAWFKTTSATGGEIIGQGDQTGIKTFTRTNPTTGQQIVVTTDSGTHDREISTTSDGHVTFTISPGAPTTIRSSAGGYNDGRWHQAVATLSSRGMVLYVDGAQVAADASATRAVDLAGYWRIGGNAGYAPPPDPTLPPGPRVVPANYFTGSIDEAAAYVGTALTAAQVANQYAIAKGTGTVNRAPIAGFATSVTGLSVSFDGSASSDADGTIASYAWSFGDGSTGTGRTVSHTYAAPGAYSPTLVVTDDKGASGSAGQSVTVAAGAAGFASDAFGRTTTGGLGQADLGGVWTTTGGSANFADDGSAAVLATGRGSTLTARLPLTSSSNSDVVVSTRLSAVPSGGSAFVNVIGRAVGAQDYRATVVVPSGGGAVSIRAAGGGTDLASRTISDLRYSQGDQLRVRVQVLGTGPTIVRARVWKVGAVEPATWQVSATDTTAALQTPGSVGFTSYLGSGSSLSSMTFQFDDFAAEAADAGAR